MTAPGAAEPLLDARIHIDALPANGRSLEITASPIQRAAIAERLQILSVESFASTLTARSLRGGIRVKGRLVADVTQQCVVSFEPVPEHIEEMVDRVFLPGRADDDNAIPGSEIFVDLQDEDIPDHFEGRELDVSELLVETLSLALDPYPRRPGASIAEYGATDEDGPESDYAPFAALKALKSAKDEP